MKDFEMDLLDVVARFRDAAVAYKIASRRLTEAEDMFKLVFREYTDAHRALITTTTGDIIPDEAETPLD